MARSGFTLLEMMIVVVIIAVSAALAGPAMVTAFAEHRVSEAAIDLVRLGRRARSEAIAYNRAHVLRYTDTSAPGSDGRVLLYRGVSGGCNSNWNNWVTLTGSPACGLAGSMCLDQTNMGDSRWHVGSNVTQMRAPGYAPLDICYQPNGATMMRYGAGISGPFFEGNATGGGIVFTFQRIHNGTPDGPARRVVFPIGATPRVLL